MVPTLNGSLQGKRLVDLISEYDMKIPPLSSEESYTEHPFQWQLPVKAETLLGLVQRCSGVLLAGACIRALVGRGLFTSLL